MIKKAGQIVPRRLFRAKDQRHQYRIKFGCDAEIIGNHISALGPVNAPVVIVQPYCWRRGQRQRITAIWPIGVTIEMPYGSFEAVKL